PAAGGEENLTPIPSPLVGTFYRVSSPDADPFVQVGSRVNKDTVVCIIEAMKVMNEIKAETSGVVKRILIENATAVQFGEPMFLIEKG
ncbi:MAG TPA: acetyl-CoA carboxylase biotin carboxyl carrier protein, partial [Kiritimatiellia bacterium]|nr:acetyl-CoA carboxylase biotin carboxyl carrier protein [Kiritimatiellia bacterium]